ncbi:MAG TPA: hypothetical protein VJZ71_01190 [Phycisphaerae bacterium]|nr:hypothetical protein [Phycisphaerae bacterium]
MLTRRWYCRIGITVLLGALTGCHAPASKLSEADLGEPSKVKSAAPSYWEHEPKGPVTSGYRKVALVEFAIEYVTEKLESLADNQPGVVIHEFIPIGLATSMAGAGRIRIQLDEAMRKEFPDELHRFFVDRLEAEGMTLVPREAIRASKAFKSLRLEKPGYRDLGHAFNVAGTDVGVPRLLVVEPATGFDVIVGTNDFRTVEQVEQDLIKEVGADVALRVRFRLSVYRQFASMEKWSILRVTKGDTFGYHFAERSLVSDETVVGKEQFLPVAGIIKQIDTDQYRLAIKKLYPPFLNMAVHTLVEQSTIAEAAPIEDAS